jgi:hypothetical protein
VKLDEGDWDATRTLVPWRDKMSSEVMCCVRA